MGNKVARFLVAIVALAIIAGGVVMLIGNSKNWETSTEYSNGFCAAGILLLALGCINIVGAHNSNPDEGKQYNDEVDGGTFERFKQMRRDISKGYNFLIICGSAGVLLLGVSFLVMKLL
jgi:hypothetical protein